MNILQRMILRCKAWVGYVLKPDFTATHYPIHACTRAPYPDFFNETLPGQRRGESADDFLAGYPHRHDPNETCAGFHRRTTMIVIHGWRIPTPPRLPVYD
jgi:hypothetical protein